MLNLPTGHFAEATAVWVGCVLAFVLVVLLRRVWVRRAKARKVAARSAAADPADVGHRVPVEESP